MHTSRGLLLMTLGLRYTFYAPAKIQSFIRVKKKRKPHNSIKLTIQMYAFFTFCYLTANIYRVMRFSLLLYWHCTICKMLSLSMSIHNNITFNKIKTYLGVTQNSFPKVNCNFFTLTA